MDCVDVKYAPKITLDNQNIGELYKFMIIYFIIVVTNFQNSIRILMSTNEIPASLYELSQGFTEIADSDYSIIRNEGVGSIKLKNKSIL